MVENKADGKFFVTARGWEDLSELIKSYERAGLEISVKQVMQFLQKEETAQDFADYYRLYRKYGEDYAVAEILQGDISEERRKEKTALAAGDLKNVLL